MSMIRLFIETFASALTEKPLPQVTDTQFYFGRCLMVLLFRQVHAPAIQFAPVIQYRQAMAVKYVHVTLLMFAPVTQSVHAMQYVSAMSIQAGAGEVIGIQIREKHE
jgi:hypothetical protein